MPDTAGHDSGGNGRARDGWLNRVLQQLPGAHHETAYAIGREHAGVLGGAAPVQRWSPDSDLLLSPQAIALARLVMREDPMFDAALTQALALSDGDGDAVAMQATDDGMMAPAPSASGPAKGRTAEVQIAEFAATRLRNETRIASFSLNGWDTHRSQNRSLPRALARLAETILTLQTALRGPVWNKTTVVAVTEFGRTARLNGSGGSDHGTGGLMILAGGALRGGRVMGDWPGLNEAQLYDRRDLLPTRDVRSYLAWLLHSQFGLPASALETSIFPGLDLGDNPRLL